MRHIMLVAIVLSISPALVLAGSSPQAAATAGTAPALQGSNRADDSNPADEPPLNLEAARERACTLTTHALFRACQGQTKDDYWVAYANCLNLPDADDRRDCIREAEDGRHEATHFCQEQNDVRDQVCGLLGEAPYDPEIDPDDFLSPEETAKDPNPLLPLVPGSLWRYHNTNGESDEITISGETIEILGVECFVVKDIVSLGGKVTEDTDDWFAQDEDGNVWYFGELTRTLEDGQLVSLDGSWKAGVDGGKPGIIMLASPHVGDAYRQEFFLGDVEDMAFVSSITGDEQVPAADCNGHCVVTHELTAIEPGNEADKYNLAGVGTILEVETTGERVELVKFVPGSPQMESLAGWNARHQDSRPGANLKVDVPAVTNPSQSPAVIRLELARDAEVKARIYDASGRSVQALADGRLPAGSHRLEWDGTDTNHRRVAAGMYFVRVVSGSEVAARKLALVH